MSVNDDLRTLAGFVKMYCESKHKGASLHPVLVNTCDLRAVLGRDILLCAHCAKLLAHGVVKRCCCPLNPKPSCRRCPRHCYHPAYRARIREVMRFSGPRAALSNLGRLLKGRH